MFPLFQLLWFHFFCLLSWSYKLRSPIHQMRTYKSFITYSTLPAQSSVESEIDVLNTLRRLKDEREQKRKEMLAANMAADLADTVYRDFRTAHKLTMIPDHTILINGTYNYGFTSQSNDHLLLDKKNGLGGSVPSGAIILAFTNFQRELGR